VRSVAVTGLGAVTPLGNDAPSTWRAAVAGQSGIDFIKSSDASEFPVRVAAEVKDFDATGLVSTKEAHALKLDVSKAALCLGWRPALRLEQALSWIVEWYQAFAAGADLRATTLEQIRRYESLLDGL